MIDEVRIVITFIYCPSPLNLDVSWSGAHPSRIPRIRPGGSGGEITNTRQRRAYSAGGVECDSECRVKALSGYTMTSFSPPQIPNVDDIAIWLRPKTSSSSAIYEAGGSPGRYKSSEADSALKLPMARVLRVRM